MSNLSPRNKERRRLKRELREIIKKTKELKANIKTLRMEISEHSVLSGGPFGLRGLSALFRLRKK